MSLEHVEHLAEGALDELPDGQAWLIVQFNGDDADEAVRRARAMIDDAAEGADTDAMVIDDAERQEKVWRAREAGLGATAHQPDGTDTHAGWEDSAVPPARLGDYLADLEAMLERYEVHRRLALRALRPGLRTPRIPSTSSRHRESGTIGPSSSRPHVW